MDDQRTRIMTHRSWLLISLGLNALLAGLVFFASQRAQSSRLETSSPAAPETPSAAPPRGPIEPAPVVVEVVESFHWSRIEAADYAQYVENLRAIKCPERTIRTMIVADVNAVYAERAKESTRDAVERFWSIVLDRSAMELLVDMKQHELRALDEEREKLLQALLNDPDPEQTLRNDRARHQQTAEFRGRLDFLSDEKVERVHEIVNRTGTARAALYQEFESRNDRNSPEYKARLETLELQERSELEAFLTAGELEEMKLRNSNTSNVRLGLANFEASDAEVRAIAAAESDPQRQEELRRLLGTDRYAELQRARDGAYQQAWKVTERFGLPASKAVEIHRLHNESSAMAKAVREDASKTAEERMALLQSIRNQAERSLSTTLGNKAFQTYANFAGQWLAQMTNAPSP